MTKFHINSKGIPGPCRATQGNCPFGGDDGQQNHYDTLEEAEAVANKKNSEKHPLLPGVENDSDGVAEESMEVNDALPNLENESNDEELEQEEPAEKRWYVYADGTHSREEREGETPVTVSDNWDSTMKKVSRINEGRYNEIKGIDSNVNSETMSIEEQETYYLAQDDVAEGVKQGPHRSFNDKAEIRDFVLSYLGHDTANSLNYEKAEKITFTSKRDTVILGQGEKARGLAGFLGRRTHKKGIVLKSSVVRGEGDEDKRDFQLPRMLEVEYLDEEGVKRRVKKHVEAAKEGVGTYANPHVYFPKNLMK